MDPECCCQILPNGDVDLRRKKYCHVSSFSSFRGGEYVRGIGREGLDEETPLVRYPPPPQSTWSPRTSLTFGILIAILALGTIISIHLLYLQSRADNVLPPIDSSLILISRKEWCDQPDYPLPVAGVAATPARHIAVVQTGTATCNDIAACTELLRDLQKKDNGQLPYNFLVSSNGVTFEALGWENRSPMFPQYPLVLAFIGDFTKNIPTTSQLEEAFTLFDASSVMGHVTKDFTIVGKVAHNGHVPTYLFASLQNLTQWDIALSDDY